ncbi:hypothetical protein J437_LFUL010408 [Ladona fulva]|uniref:MADF domain-containing protein n=1 Tax=Ladona fulva TaxID=123851 RepID=A0A8K0K9D0_LADFU|nr:hypothetical protein J437_LFUL010408 [Ladona fulva]
MADLRCWNKERVIGFLKVYKENPCLWKVKSKEYTNKNLKNEAYEKLIAYCKPVFPEADKGFVIKKIQSLRGSFRKELKKVQESQRSGAGADEVYVPSLWYYDFLVFTKDQEVPSKSNDIGEGALEVEQTSEEEGAEDGEDVTEGQKNEEVSIYYI